MALRIARNVTAATIVCLLAVAACTSPSGGTPTAAPYVTPQAGSPYAAATMVLFSASGDGSAKPTTVSGSATPALAAQPTTGSRPVPTPTAAAPRPQVPLTLAISAPADESTVTTASVAVQGRTAPNAVVSVNGKVVAVDAAGAFSMALTLEEGANVIEVIASDWGGNVLTQDILVIYEP